MDKGTTVTIHRGSPRWFEIRGVRYEISGGPGPDRVNSGWGYEIHTADGGMLEDGLLGFDDVRRWAQELADHPEWDES